MKLREIYEKAVDTGMTSDPRGREAALKDLQRTGRDYAALKPEEKEFFDRESLQNPYADSRILNGLGDEDVKTILIGIDIEVGEILLCESLRGRGEPIDLVMSHPSGGHGLCQPVFCNAYAV